MSRLLAFQPYKVASAPPVTDPHRYWRVYAISDQNGTGIAISIAKLEFRATIGGADQTGSGTPIYSSQADGAASNAFDANASTYWSVAAQGPHWIGYDFGSAVEVKQVSITARNDTASAQSPGCGMIQYSDDGTNWVTSYPFYSTIRQASGAAQTFSAQTLSSGAKRYWKIMFYGSRSADASNKAIGFAEIELRETINGADATGSGTATASDSFSGTYDGPKAFDNTTSTLWASQGGNILHWMKYDFGSGVTKDIREIVLQCRNDASYNQVPIGMAILSSDDDVSYDIAGVIVYGNAPTAWGEIRKFQTTGASPRRELLLGTGGTGNYPNITLTFSATPTSGHLIVIGVVFNEPRDINTTGSGIGNPSNGWTTLLNQSASSAGGPHIDFFSKVSNGTEASAFIEASNWASIAAFGFTMSNATPSTAIGGQTSYTNVIDTTGTTVAVGDIVMSVFASGYGSISGLSGDVVGNVGYSNKTIAAQLDTMASAGTSPVESATASQTNYNTWATLRFV